MMNEAGHSRSVHLPAESRIAALFAGSNLADAYAIRLPPNSTRDVATLARFMFGDPAPWIQGLMSIRDTIVAGFGIKTSRKLRHALDKDAVARIDIFRVYEVHANEMILGEDDRHLDFRASVLLRPAGSNGETDEVVLTTVVHCHNLLGRAYLAVIAPFHRLVVRSVLNRAARRGWPGQ